MIGLRAGISLAIAVILCGALAAIGFAARDAVERTIVPAIAAQAESVGRSAASLVESAIAAGVPMDRLVGVESYLESLRTANRELAELKLVDIAGRSLGSAGAPPEDDHATQVVTSVTARNGAPLASLIITIDPGVVSDQVNALLVDVAFIGIVSLLVALELVALVVGARGTEALAALESRVRSLSQGRLWMHTDAAEQLPFVAPIDKHVALLHARHEKARAEAARRGDTEAVLNLDALSARTGLGTVHAGENHAATVIRPALFLFMMAEELARPFLPRLAGTMAPANLDLSRDLAISLPIVVFMAAVALSQLPFAVLSERLGRRRGFVIGAALAALSYAGSAFATDYWLFLATRATAAIGYALVFVSAQGHVIDHSRPQERTAALAVFVRAIMVAGLCGPPIGGVLADRLGDHMAFFGSATLAVLGLLVAALSMPRSVPVRDAAGVSGADLMAALKAPRLAALLFGCAFPAKFLLVAICFFLVPVELQRQGYSAAAIGRLQMIYPILMVAAVPLFASLAERHDARAGFVLTGGLVAGGGALLLLFGTSPWIVAAVLALLGLGQAMSIAPQSALVAESARHMPGGRSAGVLGLFRLIERTGNATGPAAAGFLLATAGFASASAAIGLMVVLGALGFALSGRSRASGQDRAGPGAATSTEGSRV